MRFEEFAGKLYTKDEMREAARKQLGSEMADFDRLWDTYSQQISGPTIDAKYMNGFRDIAAYHDFIASRGLSDIFVSASDAWVAESISGLIEGPRIVEVCCCDGIFLVYYALQHPDKHFLGIDVSGESLKVAKGRAAKHGAQNVSLVKANALYPCFNGADTLIVKDSLHELYSFGHDDAEVDFIRRMAPHLRKGAKVVVVGQRNQPCASPQPPENYTLEAHGVNSLPDGEGFHIMNVFRKLA